MCLSTFPDAVGVVLCLDSLCVHSTQANEYGVDDHDGKDDENDGEKKEMHLLHSRLFLLFLFLVEFFRDSCTFVRGFFSLSVSLDVHVMVISFFWCGSCGSPSSFLTTHLGCFFFIVP